MAVSEEATADLTYLLVENFKERILFLYRFLTA